MKRTMERVDVLEFFSGIGGLHYALERSGVPHRVVQAFDVDDSAVRTYRHNHRTTTGRPPNNHRTTAGPPPGNRRTTAGPPPNDHRATTGQPPGNHRATTGGPPSNHQTTTNRPPTN